MALTCLPTLPSIILGVVEPLLLVWAYISAIADPLAFYAGQTPNHPLGPDEELAPQARVFVLQLANVYLLLAAVAVICCWTPHARTARWYLFVVALADYGHIWATYRGVGDELFWDVGGWNDMVWGSVGGSVALNLVRWTTLLGLWGEVGHVMAVGEAKKDT
ncbi:hypothetical protein F5Y15DRAFT_239347 [Xylariaceae sp. FL0016]|nr:hypothetical protein F5Y15DRAFT_239347 [Xylariaceae sp. FL0016]